MKIFLIIFQSDEEDIRNQLIERIKGLGSWARISNNAWCIKSDCKNTVDIRDSLKGLLTNNSERLLVLNISDLHGHHIIFLKRLLHGLKKHLRYNKIL